MRGEPKPRKTTFESEGPRGVHKGIMFGKGWALQKVPKEMSEGWRCRRERFGPLVGNILGGGDIERKSVGEKNMAGRRYKGSNIPGG